MCVPRALLRKVWASSTHVTWELAGNADSHITPGLLNQNLQVIGVCTGKFEKYWLKPK